MTMTAPWRAYTPSPDWVRLAQFLFSPTENTRTLRHGQFTLICSSYMTPRLLQGATYNALNQLTQKQPLGNDEQFARTRH